MSEHQHQHPVPEEGSRLAIVVALNLIITVAEIVGGLISGSLSLISDALHNFSDGVAVIIAWIAIRLQRKPRTEQHTFGLKRAQVLAAVVNAGTLVAISIYLFEEAWHRFSNPHPIQGQIMTTVAVIGLLANVLGTWLLHRGSKNNMNLRAAYLHLFSDAISSIGVILGGLAITLYQITWLDPLLTVLISVYVLKESLHILSDALGMFMLRSPAGLSLQEVRQALLETDGVRDVHHTHLWEVAEQDIHFEAHVQVEDRLLSEADDLREQLQHKLEQQFGIHHVTLQLEASTHACPDAALL